MTENVCTISPRVGYNFLTVNLLISYCTADIEETESTDTDMWSLQGKEVKQGEEVQQGEGEGDGNDISAQEEDVGE